ncbi:MAG: hypothetical protein WC579_01560 [Candidatus Paceibacterota bacterium]
MNETLEELSYRVGFYRACKAEGCQRALKWLCNDDFMKLHISDIIPSEYEAGFEAGLKACFEISKKFEQALKIADGRDDIDV